MSEIKKITVTQGIVDTKNNMLATDDCGCCRRYCKFTNCCNPLDFVYVDRDWLNEYFQCGDGRDRIVLKIDIVGSPRGVCYSGNRNCIDSLSETEAQNQGVDIWGPNSAPSLTCVADNICGSVNCNECGPNCCSIFFWGSRCGDPGAMGRPDDICCNWNQYFTRITRTSARWGSLETGHCLSCFHPHPQPRTWYRNSNANFVETQMTYECVAESIRPPPETAEYCYVSRTRSTGYFRRIFRSFYIDCPGSDPINGGTLPGCCETTSVIIEDREEFSTTDDCWGGPWHQPPSSEVLIFDGNCEDEYEWSDVYDISCSTGYIARANEYVRGEVSPPNCTSQSNRLFRTFQRDTRYSNNVDNGCAYGCEGVFYRQWLSSSYSSVITGRNTDGRCNPNLCDEYRITGGPPTPPPTEKEVTVFNEIDELVKNTKEQVIVRTNQELGALDIL